MLCERNQLGMFAFSIVTKGLTTCEGTCPLKAVMLSVVISIIVAFSISFFASINANIQFAAGSVTLSSVLRVASTRGVVAVRSIPSACRALLNVATCGSTSLRQLIVSSQDLVPSTQYQIDCCRHFHYCLRCQLTLKSLHHRRKR